MLSPELTSSQARNQPPPPPKPPNPLQMSGKSTLLRKKTMNPSINFSFREVESENLANSKESSSGGDIPKLSYKDQLIQDSPNVYFAYWFTNFDNWKEDEELEEEPASRSILQVNLTSEELKKIRQNWKNALIIKLQGRGLNFEGVTAKLSQLWKISNPIQRKITLPPSLCLGILMIIVNLHLPEGNNDVNANTTDQLMVLDGSFNPNIMKTCESLNDNTIMEELASNLQHVAKNNDETQSMHDQHLEN
ncbi:hypothetical protein LguiB_001658 [Lonicera macranthoides]